jgi:hypothetical protein
MTQEGMVCQAAAMVTSVREEAANGRCSADVKRLTFSGRSAAKTARKRSARMQRSVLVLPAALVKGTGLSEVGIPLPGNLPGRLEPLARVRHLGQPFQQAQHLPRAGLRLITGQEQVGSEADTRAGTVFQLDHGASTTQ